MVWVWLQTSPKERQINTRVGVQGEEEERPSVAARPRLLVITREVGEAAEEQVKREVDAEDVEVCTEEEEKK